MKHLLRIADLAADDLDLLLARGEMYARGGGPTGVLSGRIVPLYFEEPSTRTRLAISAAVVALGGVPTALSARDLRPAVGLSMADIADAAGSCAAAVATRFVDHLDLVEFAAACPAPVLNARSGVHDPLQAVADLLTLHQRPNGLRGLRVAYVGDGTNVANSLVEACALAGIETRIATPEGFEADGSSLAYAARMPGAGLLATHDPVLAVRDADIVYTDAWVDLDAFDDDRGRGDLLPYRVDDELLAHAAPGAMVMHCLPARRGQEIAADVLDGSRCLATAQAHNRRPAAQAILSALADSELQGARFAPVPASCAGRSRRISG